MAKIDQVEHERKITGESSRQLKNEDERIRSVRFFSFHSTEKHHFFQLIQHANDPFYFWVHREHVSLLESARSCMQID